jgi:hypothetical protein
MVVLIIIFLSACGVKDDFRELQWGMTKDEVIKKEEESGNSLYEEDTSYDDEGIVIEYEGLIVNGVKADVQYEFSNKVDKFLVLDMASFDKKFADYIEKVKDEKLSDKDREKLWENLEKKNKDLIKKYESIPNDIKLNDFILFEGHYFFKDIDEEDSKEILKTLKSKYGNDPEKGDGSYQWKTKRTTIYFDGIDYVSYRATYKSLENFHKTNNGKESNGGL